MGIKSDLSDLKTVMDLSELYPQLHLFLKEEYSSQQST